MGTLHTAADEILTDALLARFDERAPGYDAANRFFEEDFDELRDAGYLDLAIPSEFGGPGLTLAQVGRLQRRLAYVAPATAVAINMHLYWTGVAAELHRAGDTSLSWLLEEAAAGHVFAAGHAEAGNDVPLFLSTTSAQRAEGGWHFTGRKSFGSLSPVWTYLGLHGMDTSDPANPRIVHAFLSRDAKGYRIEETWDTLGMRATASQDTILDRAFVPDARVALVCPAGMAAATPFHLAIFAWGMLGFANVYTGIAQRAYDLTIERAHRRTSIALTRPMAYHPLVQHHVAEMRMTLESSAALLDRTLDEWSAGVDHGPDWPLKIVAAKHVSVTGAWRIVDTALELTGGSGIFKRDRMEQLFRDARLGLIHPANTLLADELVGKLSLGIHPDEQPRWG